MGYYTRFGLTWQPHIEEVEIFLEANEDFRYAVGNDGSGGQECKWYDHQKEMLALSRRFPAVLFTLNGEGEESGDIWVEYYQAGKVQVCKAQIVVPSYDPQKMVEL